MITFVHRLKQTVSSSSKKADAKSSAGAFHFKCSERAERRKEARKHAVIPKFPNFLVEIYTLTSSSVLFVH